MLTFANKIVLITGASSGIGLACAQRFAAQGAKIILLARRKPRISQLAADLNSAYGTDCLPLIVDIRKQQEVEQALNHLPASWQSIAVLINNAGLARGSDALQQGLLENWEAMIDTNIKGLLYVTHYVLPQMLVRQQGHIINIGSIAGQECYPLGNVYCATKHAVRALSKSMRIDLMGTPIRVSEIAPGAVETEFSEVRWQDKEKADHFYHEFNPLSADDIADAVYYCATRPAHVNVAELTIMPTVQASANHLAKTGRSI